MGRSPGRGPRLFAAGPASRLALSTGMFLALATVSALPRGYESRKKPRTRAHRLVVRDFLLLCYALFPFSFHHSLQTHWCVPSLATNCLLLLGPGLYMSAWAVGSTCPVALPFTSCTSLTQSLFHLRHGRYRRNLGKN